MAAQESTIMNFAQRLAGTGTVVGVSQKDIMALSAAMASVGINAESGGSAMSKVLTKMNNAVKDGGEKLQGFAKVSGMSGQEFAETWKKDPYAAVQAFEKGLAGQNKEGKNVKEMLKDLGITELRETDTVLRLANGNKQLQVARENANKGYKEGNALSKEAETKYKTLGNQMKIFMNHVRALGIEIGSALAPVLIGMMKVLTPIIDALAKAPAPIKLMVVALGLIPVIAVPVLASLAAITGAMGLMGQAMNTATMAAGRNSKALKIYAATMGMLTNPIATTKRGLASLPTVIGNVGKSSSKNGKSVFSLGNIFKGLGSKLKGVLSIGTLIVPIFEALGGVLAAIGAPVLIVVGVIASLVAAFVIAYKKVDWFRAGIQGLWTVLKVFGAGLFGIIIKPFTTVGKVVMWVAKTVKNNTWVFKKFYDTLPDNGKLKTSVKALQGMGNAFKQVFKTLGAANSKTNQTTKVLGKGISEGTKKALGKYVKFSQDSTRTLEKMRLNNGVITKKMKDRLIEDSRSAGEEAVKQMKKRNKSNLSQLKTMLNDTNVYSGKEKQAIIDRAKEAGDAKVKKMEKLNKDIAELEEKAMADGKLSAKEKAAISKKYEERNKLATKVLSKGQKEQQAILSRLDVNKDRIGVQEAQKNIKEIIKAQNKAIADAKKKRDKLISEADTAYANGSISKAEHDKIVKKVSDRYDTEISTAKTKGKEAKKKIKKASPGVEDSINMDTGKAYNVAQKWWNQFTSMMTNLGKNAWGYIKQQSGQFGSAFVDGIIKVGNWIASVKAKADAFWNGFGTALMSKLSSVGGWVKAQSAQFGTAFINGIMNIGSWIMAVKAKADAFWRAFGTGLLSGLSSIGTYIKTQSIQFGQAFINGIMNIASWVMMVKAKANAFWAAFGSAVMSGLSAIGTWFYNVGSTLWGWIKTGWNFALTNNFALWTMLKTVAAMAWTSISGWFASMGGKLWGAVKQGWNAWVTMQGNLWSVLVTALGVAWGAIKAWFIAKGNAMGSAVANGWRNAKGVIIGVFNGIWSGAKAIWSGISSTISYWVGRAASSVVSRWNKIKSVTSSIFTGAWNIVKGIWKGLAGTISYYVGGAVNKVRNGWNWIKNHTVNAFTAAWKKTVSIWKALKGTVVYYVGGAVNRVKSGWNWIKNHTINAFTTAWKKTVSIWKALKGTVVYYVGGAVGRVKSGWNWIKNHTINAFTSAWKKTVSIWKAIKGTISYYVGGAWGKVKGAWNSIKSHTSNVFNKVASITRNIWKAIKGSVVYYAVGLWNKVRNTWNALKNNTSSTFSKVKSMIVSAWKYVKTHSVGLVSGMWSKISNIFNNMKSGVKSFSGQVKKHINNMVGGIKKGLNSLIKGVNWVSSKLGIDKKIPHLSTGTESTHTQSFVQNGAISRPTLATVNDKGRGNGSGSNGHQEVIQKANGQYIAPKGRDVTVPLGKGDIVHSGKSVQRAQKAGLFPKFASGTGNSFDLLKKAKKHKKGDDVFGDMQGAFGASGGGNKFAEFLGKTVSGGKAALDGGKKLASKGGDKIKGAAKAVGSNVSKGAKWLKDKVGELEEYLDHPGKLLDKIMEGFGVDFGNIKGEIPENLWSGMWKGLKSGITSLFSGWLQDAAGGDGGYIDLSKGINFGFYKTAAAAIAAGYPFGRPHHGLDINYKYGDKVYSTLSGKGTGKSGYNGGFGNSMWLDNGNGVQAIYGHLSKLAWNGTKSVKPGTYLGRSGGDPARQGKAAGDSSGPHLHYEMRWNGIPKDPTSWLKKHNGGGGGKKAASKWTPEIKKAAKKMGVSLSGGDIKNIVSLIQHESGGDAGVTQGNIGDINNRNGNPAKGLLQYIPQTFKSYAVKGHNNIKSGYDQLLAFFNNKRWRSEFNPMGGWSPSGPRRFAHGGMIKKHGLYEAGEGNRPEMVLPLTNKIRAMQLIDQAKSFMGVDEDGDITSTTNNSPSDDIVAQLLQQNNQLLEALISTVQNKELVVDEQAITNTAARGLGKKYQSNKYNRGGR